MHIITNLRYQDIITFEYEIMHKHDVLAGHSL